MPVIRRFPKSHAKRARAAEAARGYGARVPVEFLSDAEAAAFGRFDRIQGHSEHANELSHA